MATPWIVAVTPGSTYTGCRADVTAKSNRAISPGVPVIVVLTDTMTGSLSRLVSTWK